MTADQFEHKLRELVRRQPFFSFVVEFVDDRVLVVDHPKILIGGGGASFLTPDFEFVEFNCEEVRAMHLAVPGATP